MTLSFRGRLVASRGDKLQRYGATWYQTADMDVIEAAFRRLLHKAHPDKGGSDFAFQELQNTFKQAKEAVR